MIWMVDFCQLLSEMRRWVAYLPLSRAAGSTVAFQQHLGFLGRTLHHFLAAHENGVQIHLKIGMIVIGVQTFYQFIVTGIIIIIAAYFEFIQDSIVAKLSKKS